MISDGLRDVLEFGVRGVHRLPGKSLIRWFGAAPDRRQLDLWISQLVFAGRSSRSFHLHFLEPSLPRGYQLEKYLMRVLSLTRSCLMVPG